MKKILFAAILFVCFSCNQHPVSYSPQPTSDTYDDYTIVTGPTGQQMVYYNDNGVTRMLEYALFMNLWNNGGLYNVHNYYTSHPTSFRTYDRNYYRSWKTKSYHQPVRTYSNTPRSGNVTVPRSTTTTRNIAGGNGITRTPTYSTSPTRNIAGGSQSRSYTPSVSTPSRSFSTSSSRSSSSSWGGGSKRKN